MEQLIKIMLDFSRTFLTGKLIVIFLIFLYFNSLLRKRSLIQLKVLGLFIIVLFLRDFIFSSLLSIKTIVGITDNELNFVIYFSDILFITIFLLWLRTYTRRNILDIFYYVFNLVFFVIFLLNLIMPFSEYFGTNFLILSRIIIIINSIYFIFSIYRVNEFNTQNPELIYSKRSIITFLVIIYNLITYIAYIFLNYSFDNIVMQNILIPLTSFIPLYMFNVYDKVIEIDEVKKFKFLQNNLDSLFDFMKNLQTAISVKIDMKQILQLISESSAKSVEAEAGSVHLVDSVEDVLKAEAVYGIFPPPFQVPDIVKVREVNMQNYFKSNPIKLGETIFGECVKNGTPIFIKNTELDPRMVNNINDDALYISSIMCVPLIVSRRVLGVLSIIKKQNGDYFSDSDFEHVKTFSDYASLTIDFIMTYAELIEKREMERELGIAAGIQKKLLPSKLPVFKSLNLATYTLPAKGVSGDYYDIIEMRDNKIGVVICDVAGKGVPAALVMVMIRTILHLISSPDRDAMTTVTWINRGLVGSIDLDRYATLSFLIYDQVTKEVSYSNAAHHPMLLFRRSIRKLEVVDTDGLPIGIEKTAKYGQKRFRLNPGDLLLLYTDGIIEAMNTKGEFFSYERLEKIVSQNIDMEPKDLINKINDELKTFVGTAAQHDDQTLLILKSN